MVEYIQLMLSKAYEEYPPKDGYENSRQLNDIALACQLIINEEFIIVIIFILFDISVIILYVSYIYYIYFIFIFVISKYAFIFI